MNDVITFESEEFGKVGTIAINDNPYDNGKNVDELFINTYFDDIPEEMKQDLRINLAILRHKNEMINCSTEKTTIRGEM